MNARILIASVAVAVGGSTLATNDASADPVIRQIDDDRVSIVDYRGSPPFRRRIVRLDSLSAAERARVVPLPSGRDSNSDSAPGGELVRVVDFRGAPPFRRSAVRVEESTVELARFEEVLERDRPRRTRGPFGKWPTRR